MTPRSQKRLLWALAGGLGLALAASAAALALWPLGIETPALPPENPVAEADPSAGPAVEPLSAFAVIYERNLRRPLYDPEPAAATAPRRRHEVNLVGTAVEPGYTYAFLRTKAGKVQMVGLGQDVDGVRVTAINNGSATIEFQGVTYTLEVKKKEMVP